MGFNTIYKCRFLPLFQLLALLTLVIRSKVHFQQALSATAAVSTQSEGPTDAEDAPSAANKGKKLKVFKCTHPNCMHQYRQKSGLRYHLTHVCSSDLRPILSLTAYIVRFRILNFYLFILGTSGPQWCTTGTAGCSAPDSGSQGCPGRTKCGFRGRACSELKPSSRVLLSIILFVHFNSYYIHLYPCSDRSSLEYHKLNVPSHHDELDTRCFCSLWHV